MPSASLLCWNVAGRVTALADQQRRVLALGADLVCLQEVTVRTLGLWRQWLLESGWGFVLASSAEQAAKAGRQRPLLTLTAGRRELERVELLELPWSERAVAVRVTGLELVNVHSPTSPKPHLAKVLTHERVAAHLAAGSGPRLVCGDLNTPRKEHPDGRIWTFARDRYGRLREERGTRWDEAELALIKGLEAHGFRDAFRALHGPAVRELSWEWQRWGGGYRLDHLIASEEVVTDDLRYLHDWRRDGLSDHSPLYAELSWPAEDSVDQMKSCPVST